MSRQTMRNNLRYAKWYKRNFFFCYFFAFPVKISSDQRMQHLFRLKWVLWMKLTCESRCYRIYPFTRVFSLWLQSFYFSFSNQCIRSMYILSIFTWPIINSSIFHKWIYHLHIIRDIYNLHILKNIVRNDIAIEFRE